MITHHTGGPYAPCHHMSKQEKLRACIEGLMTALSHVNELKIVVVTVDGANVTDSLPRELLEYVEIRMEKPDDPMTLGFLGQDVFFARAADYDWFIWMEDDIVIEDAMILEKIEAFNAAVGRPEVLLMPNRFEFYHGVKFHTDMYAWSVVSPVTLGRWTFKQCGNANAGCYFLNRDQMSRFREKARGTYMRQSIFGLLESAGWGQLLECFQVYRPCHPNLHFLEVRHWDVRFYEEYLAWAAVVGVPHRRPVRWD